MLTSSPAVPAPQGGMLPLAFRRPAAGAVFTIAADATWPALVFEAGGAGPHRANAGRTEAALRARDRAEYAAPRRPGARRRYLGVCHADRLLG